MGGGYNLQDYFWFNSSTDMLKLTVTHNIMSSKAIVTQEELSELIGSNISDFETIMNDIDEYSQRHKRSFKAFELLREVVEYTKQKEDGTYPIHPDDFDELCPIDTEFFRLKFSKRIYNLLNLMNDIPNNSYPVTWNMIYFIGKTIANRVFEICSGIDGYKGIFARFDILNILCNVFLRIHRSNQRDLVPYFAYAVILLCKDKSIFYDKQNREINRYVYDIESRFINAPLSLENFPELKSEE